METGIGCEGKQKSILEIKKKNQKVERMKNKTKSV